MFPYTILFWVLATVLVPIIAAIYFARRVPKKTGSSLTVEQAETNWPQERAKSERAIRAGGITGYGAPRSVGKSPILAAPYGRKLPVDTSFGKRRMPPTKKPVVVLTPRQIESVNIKRKLRGYPPLNRAGVKNAISSAWDTPRREPQTSNDWLLYLILWETFSDDHNHKSHTCAGTGGFTIDPNQPYNGQGGEFAGAGASGSWTDAPQDVASAAALISTGSHFADTDSKYQPGYTVGGYDPAPSPDPSYAPDLSPSYSGSSYSSSDSSSSSSDSSSSSSGGDSGSSGGDSGSSGGGD